MQQIDKVGLGLRQAHYQDVLQQKPDIGWFEVHSENYFNRGGPNHYFLTQVRESYPLALHGVGLSIGSSDPLNYEYLQQLKRLAERYQPFLISDHLSWSSFQGEYFPDLYPLPFTEAVVVYLVERIQQVQEFLGRQLILENVASYVTFTASQMSEWQFINEITRRSGCGLLLDVNNVAVNSCNHDYNGADFIENIDPLSVTEIHLSGATHKKISGKPFIIDSHDDEVTTDVWCLFQQAIRRFGCVPSLIEWDNSLPDLAVLLQQARLAEQILKERCQTGHCSLTEHNYAG